jgi:SAM-dependent methyltransferase
VESVGAIGLYHRGVPGTNGAEESSPVAAPVYALGSDVEERERLQRQSAELRSVSAALLDHVGVLRGQSALDLGCGPLGVIDLLSERVGPEGRVVGMDLNPANVALAQSLVHDQGLGNVSIVEGDARHTGLEDSSFDVVHARTLLINIPDPAVVVTEMTRLVRPGGWVAVMDPDMAVQLYHPHNPAWDRLHEIFKTAFQIDGADPFIGRRLPEILRAAGLTDIGVEARVDLYPLGHSRRTIRLDLVRSMRAKIVARGIASEQELDDLDRAAREHLADPFTLVMPGVYFMAWGRKQAS